MNEHLKLQIGKHGTISNRIFANGISEIEYVQGVLRNIEDDIITIEQYIPYIEFLEGKNPPSIIRVFRLSMNTKFEGVWRD